MPLIVIVMVRGSGELAGVVKHGLVLGRGADLLEGRNRHGGQKADDDDDDHDFYEGEALSGAVRLFHFSYMIISWL